MQDGGCHAGALESASHSYVNITLANFDWLYAPCPEYLRFALQVLEVDLAHGLGAGRHGDHPRRGTRLQSIQQQVGQQERGQVVHREGVLQAVGGDMATWPRNRRRC